jgi:hypothetical protein
VARGNMPANFPTLKSSAMLGQRLLFQCNAQRELLLIPQDCHARMPSAARLPCVRPRSPFFTQDCAISLSPSASGSLRTAQGVSKYIVARFSELYTGQYGRPS